MLRNEESQAFYAGRITSSKQPRSIVAVLNGTYINESAGDSGNTSYKEEDMIVRSYASGRLTRGRGYAVDHVLLENAGLQESTDFEAQVTMSDEGQADYFEERMIPGMDEAVIFVLHATTRKNTEAFKESSVNEKDDRKHMSIRSWPIARAYTTMTNLVALAQGNLQSIELDWVDYAEEWDGSGQTVEKGKLTIHSCAFVTEAAFKVLQPYPEDFVASAEDAKQSTAELERQMADANERASRFVEEQMESINRNFKPASPEVLPMHALRCTMSPIADLPSIAFTQLAPAIEDVSEMALYGLLEESAKTSGITMSKFQSLLEHALDSTEEPTISLSFFLSMRIIVNAIELICRSVTYGADHVVKSSWKRTDTSANDPEKREILLERYLLAMESMLGDCEDDGQLSYTIAKMYQSSDIQRKNPILTLVQRIMQYYVVGLVLGEAADPQRNTRNKIEKNVKLSDAEEKNTICHVYAALIPRTRFVEAYTADKKDGRSLAQLVDSLMYGEYAKEAGVVVREPVRDGWERKGISTGPFVLEGTAFSTPISIPVRTMLERSALNGRLSSENSKALAEYAQALLNEEAELRATFEDKNRELQTLNVEVENSFFVDSYSLFYRRPVEVMVAFPLTLSTQNHFVNSLQHLLVCKGSPPDESSIASRLPFIMNTANASDRPEYGPEWTVFVDGKPGKDWWLAPLAVLDNPSEEEDDGSLDLDYLKDVVNLILDPAPFIDLEPKVAQTPAQVRTRSKRNKRKLAALSKLMDDYGLMDEYFQTIVTPFYFVYTIDEQDPQALSNRLSATTYNVNIHDLTFQQINGFKEMLESGQYKGIRVLVNQYTQAFTNVDVILFYDSKQKLPQINYSGSAQPTVSEGCHGKRHSRYRSSKSKGPMRNIFNTRNTITKKDADRIVDDVETFISNVTGTLEKVERELEAAYGEDEPEYELVEATVDFYNRVIERLQEMKKEIEEAFDNQYSPSVGMDVESVQNDVQNKIYDFLDKLRLGDNEAEKLAKFVDNNGIDFLRQSQDYAYFVALMEFKIVFQDIDPEIIDPLLVMGERIYVYDYLPVDERTAANSAESKVSITDFIPKVLAHLEEVEEEEEEENNYTKNSSSNNSFSLAPGAPRAKFVPSQACEIEPVDSTDKGLMNFPKFFYPLPLKRIKETKNVNWNPSNLFKDSADKNYEVDFVNTHGSGATGNIDKMLARLSNDPFINSIAQQKLISDLAIKMRKQMGADVFKQLGELQKESNKEEGGNVAQDAFKQLVQEIAKYKSKDFDALNTTNTAFDEEKEEKLLQMIWSFMPRSILQVAEEPDYVTDAETLVAWLLPGDDATVKQKANVKNYIENTTGPDSPLALHMAWGAIIAVAVRFFICMHQYIHLKQKKEKSSWNTLRINARARDCLMYSMLLIQQLHSFQPLKKNDFKAFPTYSAESLIFVSVMSKVAAYYISMGDVIAATASTSIFAPDKTDGLKKIGEIQTEKQFSKMKTIHKKVHKMLQYANPIYTNLIKEATEMKESVDVATRFLVYCSIPKNLYQYIIYNLMGGSRGNIFPADLAIRSNFKILKKKNEDVDTVKEYYKHYTTKTNWTSIKSFLETPSELQIKGSYGIYKEQGERYLSKAAENFNANERFMTYVDGIKTFDISPYANFNKETDGKTNVFQEDTVSQPFVSGLFYLREELESFMSRTNALFGSVNNSTAVKFNNNYGKTMQTLREVYNDQEGAPFTKKDLYIALNGKSSYSVLAYKTSWYSSNLLRIFAGILNDSAFPKQLLLDTPEEISLAEAYHAFQFPDSMIDRLEPFFEGVGNDGITPKNMNKKIREDLMLYEANIEAFQETANKFGVQTYYTNYVRDAYDKSNSTAVDTAFANYLLVQTQADKKPCFPDNKDIKKIYQMFIMLALFTIVEKKHIYLWLQSNVHGDSPSDFAGLINNLSLGTYEKLHDKGIIYVSIGEPKEDKKSLVSQNYLYTKNDPKLMQVQGEKYPEQSGEFLFLNAILRLDPKAFFEN